MDEIGADKSSGSGVYRAPPAGDEESDPLPEGSNEVNPAIKSSKDTGDKQKAAQKESGMSIAKAVKASEDSSDGDDPLSKAGKAARKGLGSLLGSIFGSGSSTREYDESDIAKSTYSSKPTSGEGKTSEPARGTDSSEISSHKAPPADSNRLDSSSTGIEQVVDAVLPGGSVDSTVEDQSETAAGSSSQNAAIESVIASTDADSEGSPLPESTSTSESSEKSEENAPKASEVSETAESSEDGKRDEKTGEGREWEPPEIYAHKDQSGKIVIVDKNGKPIDSPPWVYEDGDSGKIKVWYPGMDKSQAFSIEMYIPDDEGVYVPGEHTGEEGTRSAYEWEPPEIYAYKDQDGKITFVDKNGKPVDSPPWAYEDGETGVIKAWYPGLSKSEAFKVEMYIPGKDGVYIAHEHAEEETRETEKWQPPEMYAHLDQGGKVTLVDKNGKPVENPPWILKGKDPGEYLAWYPGMPKEQAFKVKLYSPAG
jgi:hypothetical protein